MRPGPFARGPGRTTLVAFRADRDFRFAIPNASAASAQAAPSRATCLTNLPTFLRQVVLARTDIFQVERTPRRLNVLPPEDWAGADLSGARIGLLLPTQALGDSVPILAFIEALDEAFDLRSVRVFCAGPAADIFRRHPKVTADALWVTASDIAALDTIIDLGQAAPDHDIDLAPLDLESVLLERFDLEPSSRMPLDGRALPAGPLEIGILPLASSPLRSLPPEAVLALVDALRLEGRVHLCLNANQGQGRLLTEALDGHLPPDVRLIDSFASVAEMMAAIGAFDYGIFADSGPAHLSKLECTPGVAVYSSASGEVLQGRFRNLARWTIPFEGPHCRAPCGLAKLRQSADGAVGCMGSLGMALEDLPGVPGGSDAEVVRTLFETPVPCIASLAENPGPLVDFVMADLADRRSRGAG